MIGRKIRTLMILALGIGIAVLAIRLALPALAQEGLPPKEHLPVKKVEYSPYVDQHFPTRVLWGDTHAHTILSMDDGFLGTTLGPDEAFRYARGDEMLSNTGQRVKLQRPLDFLAVTDHAEYLGIADLVLKSDPDLLATEYGRRWHDMVKAGGDEALKAVWEVSIASIKGQDLLKNDKIKRSVWERVIDSASKYYEPGKFTTFNGFEWTSFPEFNNLHRCVIFRDGPERVKQVLPFSAMDSSDPEGLWKYMANYEERSGGQVLAIPHNGNMSNGRMFEGQSRLGEIPVGQWHGPVESGYGVHLVFVEKRSEGRVPDLATVREAVHREWTNARRLDENEKFYQSLLKRYVVTVE